MTRYLLGDLPEIEQTAVEQEYFADPEKFEEVWAVENDLVDRYVRGRHYFRARVSDQFDAVIHIDETRAVEPLERTTRWQLGDVPERIHMRCEPWL